MSAETPDWTTNLGQGGVYPFVEGEDCNIVGLGHQDRAEFAAAVCRYDLACGMDPEGAQWTADDISHGWALLDADSGRVSTERDGAPVLESTPGALPITTLWFQR